jgi:hypothetical protein
MFSMLFLESSLPHCFSSEKDMEYWNRIRYWKPLKKEQIKKVKLSATENYQMFTLAIVGNNSISVSTEYWDVPDFQKT